MKKVLILSVMFLFIAGSLFAYKPGTYTGKAKGKVPKHSGEVVVKVTVSKTRIKKIKIIKYDVTTHADKKFMQKYVDGCKKAKVQIPKAIIKKQSTSVATVAKATKTSKAIIKAVENALKKAK
jgi:uncharacterized protein with FMN-binding domain